MARLFRHEKACVFEVPMMRVFYCFMGWNKQSCHQPPFGSDQRQSGVHVEIEPAVRIDVLDQV